MNDVKINTVTNEPRFYSDLCETLSFAWQLIEQGVTDRNTMAHTPVLSTVGPSDEPKSRSMVLRDARRVDRMLLFYSDSRSWKIEEIISNPMASVLFYEMSKKIQVRMVCILSVHMANEYSKKRWDNVQKTSRISYQSALPPGARIENPATLEYQDEGERNFAVLEAEIRSLEWLYLSSRGNRRALFQWDKGIETSSWLVP